MAAVSAARFTRGVHSNSTRSLEPLTASTRVWSLAVECLKEIAVGKSTSASGWSRVSANWLDNAGGMPKASRRLVTSPPSLTSNLTWRVASPCRSNCTATIRPLRTSFAAPDFTENCCTATSSPNNGMVTPDFVAESCSVASNCATRSFTTPV